MTCSLTWRGPLQRVFAYSKADWDYAIFTLLTLRLQAFQMILPLLLLSSPTQCFLAWIFLFLLLTSLVKKNSPRWFNSQCAKAVNNKNHYFKEWKRLQTQYSRTSFIQSRNTCSKTIKMSNPLLSNASTTTLPPARLALAPFGLWPKLHPKTFANHLSLH